VLASPAERTTGEELEPWSRKMFPTPTTPPRTASPPSTLSLEGTILAGALLVFGTYPQSCLIRRWAANYAAFWLMRRLWIRSLKGQVRGEGAFKGIKVIGDCMAVKRFVGHESGKGGGEPERGRVARTVMLGVSGEKTRGLPWVEFGGILGAGARGNAAIRVSGPERT